ncbi:Group 1 glycosyl transferase [[Clostridium] ultunense Esp]|nr:Group 1 glycosyl transferase [[Clostridium] ultunense Esp]
MNPLLILTPGSYPIPSPRASSVELALFSWASLLHPTIPLTIVGKEPADEAIMNGKGVGPSFHYIRCGDKREYLMKSIEVIRREKPKIIQVENRPHFLPALKKNFPEIPLLLSLHSFTFLRSDSISPSLRSQSLKLADAILVNSHALKRLLVRQHAEIGEKIEVIPLGVDADRFHPLPENERQRRRRKFLHGSEWNRPILLYVGRLIPQKGVHLLLQAVKRLQMEKLAFLLLIAGGNKYGINRETPYVSHLKREAVSLKDSVRFLPYIPHDEIHQLYPAADLFLMPSIGFEAFGLVNLEAMSSCLPVVASRNGGIREIIRHEKEGLLVPIGEPEPIVQAVKTLLLNPPLAKEMGNRGRKRVKAHFTWHHVAHRMRRVYGRFL